jgi:hypothetical protein
MPLPLGKSFFKKNFEANQTLAAISGGPQERQRE